MRTLKLYATHQAALAALREARDSSVVANLSRMSLRTERGDETYYRKVPESEFERMWFRGMSFHVLEWHCDLSDVPGDVVAEINAQVREEVAA